MIFRSLLWPQVFIETEANIFLKNFEASSASYLFRVLCYFHFADVPDGVPESGSDSSLESLESCRWRRCKLFRRHKWEDNNK